MKFFYHFSVRVILIVHGYYHCPTIHTEEDVDYSKYLGPDWKKNKLTKRVSTMVGSHCSYLDMPTLFLNPSMPAVTPTFTPVADL